LSGVQLVEQGLGLLQIERVEAFGEPAATGRIVTRYRNVTAARARLTLSGGQKVTGPGAAPGAAILVP
jgi:hypothetical protein